MCLIVFAFQQHAQFPLVVLANRDEFYARPTRTAHWWEDSPAIFGGRDLKAQGTWLGVNKNGRFAAVTNVREPGSMTPGARSRGDLPRNFLSAELDPVSYLAGVKVDAGLYSGFNLLVGDSGGLWFFSNRDMHIRKIQSGIFGISNGGFDEAWPKLAEARNELRSAFQDELDDYRLMRILSDTTQASDHLLPDTGVSPDIEKLLSSRFIASNDYGTRASTLVKFSNRQSIEFTEHNFSSENSDAMPVSESFMIQARG